MSRLPPGAWRTEGGFATEPRPKIPEDCDLEATRPYRRRVLPLTRSQDALDLFPPSAGRGLRKRNSHHAYSADQPPSIERLAPVICAASSLHKNSARAATCSDVTNSLVG